MKSAHLFVSLIGLFLGFFLIFAGIFLFAAPYIPALSSALRSLVINHLESLSTFGLILLFMGALTLTLLMLLNRRRYFLLKMGGVSVEDSLISHFAQESVQKFFPDQTVECDVIVKRGGKLEILANIPHLPEETKSQTLHAIEKELTVLLLKQCQYTRDFTLNLSFH